MWISSSSQSYINLSKFFSILNVEMQPVFRAYFAVYNDKVTIDNIIPFIGIFAFLSPSKLTRSIIIIIIVFKNIYLL